MSPKEKFLSRAKEITDKHGQFDGEAPENSRQRTKKALVV